MSIHLARMLARLLASGARLPRRTGMTDLHPQGEYRMIRAFFAVAALLALAACADATMPGATTVNVSAIAPAPNASGVARGDTIRLWMDMPMDSASCAMRFSLHRGDSTGAEVPGRLRFGEGYRQMMFIPDSLLAPGTRYFAHMRDSMMMGSGTHMDGMGRQMMGGGRMMMGSLPAGVTPMSDGMGWSFTTGN